MSKFVKVRTELRDLEMIKRALDDLGLPYTTGSDYRHGWSGSTHQADLVVTAGTFHGFAFRRNTDGIYDILGDSMGLGAQKEMLQRLNQRYAYHKVVHEVSQAGFSLAEEKTDRDQTIRLVVRRWS